MNKIILALGMISMVALSSCNKDKKIEENADATDVVVHENGNSDVDEKMPVSTVEVPEFSTPEITQFAKEYVAYLENPTTEETKEWSRRVSDMVGKMNQEDVRKWSELTTKAMEK